MLTVYMRMNVGGKQQHFYCNIIVLGAKKRGRNFAKIDTTYNRCVLTSNIQPFLCEHFLWLSKQQDVGCVLFFYRTHVSSRGI